MKYRDHILDLVRGMSALLVMLGHLRGFVFLDLGELKNPSIATKAFYFATGLGHQAVMVFFVLSGYFVGGSVLSGLGSYCGTSREDGGDSQPFPTRDLELVSNGSSFCLPNSLPSP